MPNPSDGNPTDRDAVGESRTARSRRAILDAATAVFLRNGYLGTTMDEIAARAGASKQTVYKHFADKERLFTEIVTRTVERAGDRVHCGAHALGESGDVAADLREYARRQLRFVMQPQILQLRRLVIGEAGRFPALGRVFYDHGPGRTVAALTGALERLNAGGSLQLDDPALAAAHFNWLIMSIPLNHAMFLGDDAIPPDAELDRYADAGVDVFLAAYGRR
jgi:TetR/AcrR family transcriptional regulator, mexJK operon transcriptional repressor